MDAHIRSRPDVHPDARELARMRDDHPGWDIARIRGQWPATRERVLSEVEMSYGLRHVLLAETAGRLWSALSAQRSTETSTPEQPI
jgi:hypothetical protein